MNYKYDWTTSIVGQTKGTGKCKCCELQLVTRKGFTDVFTLVPKSKRFFNFNKNKNIDIYTIPLRDTEKQIDWKCPDCGREWRSPSAHRIKGNKNNYSFVGCQECYTCSLEMKITPVASVPKLIKHWDFKKNKAKGLDPNLTSAHDTRSAHWLCKNCAYSWKSSIKGRLNSDGKCPICERTAFKPIVPGVTDVVDGIDECSYCKGTKILPGYNSFAHNHPDLLAEMDEIANYLLPVGPDEVGDDSAHKFWFNCKNNPKHKYPMSPRTRLMFEKRHREPCPYCHGQRRKLHHFVSYGKIITTG